MGWGSVVGGAISAVGSIGSSLINNSSAKQMRGNAVQTRVADMRKAGINPMAAFMKGGDAAAQNVQLQQPDFSPIANIADQVSRRMTATSAKQQADNNSRQTDASTTLMATQSAKALADAEVSRKQASYIDSQKHLTDEQALTQGALRANYAASTGLSSAQALKTQYDAAQSKVVADYLNTDVGKESARVGYDNKAGGVVGLINAGSNYLDRITGNHYHSAKTVNDDNQPRRMYLKHFSK